MVYVQEVEKSGSERKIVRYYKCPLCGLKLLDEIMKIVRINGSVKIIINSIKHDNETAVIHARGKKRRAPSRRA
jgi:hypothetical protein